MEELKEALKKEFEELKGKHNQMPAKPILNYLLITIEKDNELYQAITNQEKTFKGCLEDMKQAVRKAIGNSGYMEDSAVFQLAVDYYKRKEQVKPPEPPKQESTPPPQVVTPPESEQVTTGKQEPIQAPTKEEPVPKQSEEFEQLSMFG